MIFVDASALVAVLAREPDAQVILAKIKEDTRRYCSAVGRWETVVALCRMLDCTPAEASRVVDDFLETFEIRLVPIDKQEADLAVAAYDRYGRGRHPASLNMGDCFAYACAKSCGAALLYKGDDFVKTDLA